MSQDVEPTTRPLRGQALAFDRCTNGGPGRSLCGRNSIPAAVSHWKNRMLAEQGMFAANVI